MIFDQINKIYPIGDYSMLWICWIHRSKFVSPVLDAIGKYNSCLFKFRYINNELDYMQNDIEDLPNEIRPDSTLVYISKWESMTCKIAYDKRYLIKVKEWIEYFINQYLQ